MHWHSDYEARRDGRIVNITIVSKKAPRSPLAWATRWVLRYSAKFSGSPLIETCGQQEHGHGRLEPLLHEPLLPIARPMVK